MAAAAYKLDPRDPLAIPKWLRVDATEAARRREYWAQHPPQAMPAFRTKPSVTDADVERFAAQAEAERKERATIRLNNLSAKLKAAKVDTTGLTWDVMTAKWVPDPNYKPVVKDDGLVRTPAAPAKVKAAPAAKSPRAAPSGSTVAVIVQMLGRPEGATLDELVAATGQQRHSCGARMSGIKKTRTIVKADEARGTVYRLTPEKD